MATFLPMSFLRPFKILRNRVPFEIENPIQGNITQNPHQPIVMFMIMATINPTIRGNKMRNVIFILVMIYYQVFTVYF